jgi:hypothetical protein
MLFELLRLPYGMLVLGNDVNDWLTMLGVNALFGRLN